MLRRLLIALTAVLVALPALVACSVVGSTVTITVRFPDTAGLFVGNDVGILGVSVGEVTAIRPRGADVDVVLRIDGDVAIPAAAQAVIVSRSVATDRYVELTPRYAGGPRLGDGAVIDSDRTRTPADFDEILGALDHLASGLAGDGEGASPINEFLEASATVIGPNADRAGSGIERLATALEKLDSHRDSAVDALGSADRLTAALVAHDALIETFIDNVAATSAVLSGQRKDFTATLRTTRQAIEALSRFTARNERQFDGVLDDTNTLLDVILERKKQVEEFIEVLPLALQNVARAQTRGGILLMVPLGDAMFGEYYNQCRQLVPALCEMLGLDPLFPLGSPIGAGR